MMKEKLVLAFSGGLDTSFCVKYLSEEKGFDVLLDDRKKSAGVKFKDSDLIGAPIRIVISPRNLENKKAEVKISSEAEANIVDLKDLVSYVTNKHEELLEEVK